MKVGDYVNGSKVLDIAQAPKKKQFIQNKKMVEHYYQY